MKTEKLINLKSFNWKNYENMALDNLVLYAISIVQELNLEKNFYNIVVACYKLFPKQFSLIGFPQYPDAKRVHDCLWHCSYKTKGWLVGKTKHGYDFSSIGLKILKQTKRMIKNPILQEMRVKRSKKKRPHDRRREAIIVRELMNSRAFKKYKTGNIDAIEKVDICFALQGTLDTPKDILKKNLKMIKNIILQYNNKEALDFFSIIENKFKDEFKGEIN